MYLSFLLVPLETELENEARYGIPAIIPWLSVTRAPPGGRSVLCAHKAPFCGDMFRESTAGYRFLMKEQEKNPPSVAGRLGRTLHGAADGCIVELHRRPGERRRGHEGTGHLLPVEASRHFFADHFVGRARRLGGNRARQATPERIAFVMFLRRDDFTSSAALYLYCDCAVISRAMLFLLFFVRVKACALTRTLERGSC